MENKAKIYYKQPTQHVQPTQMQMQPMQHEQPTQHVQPMQPMQPTQHVQHVKMQMMQEQPFKLNDYGFGKKEIIAGIIMIVIMIAGIIAAVKTTRHYISMVTAQILIIAVFIGYIVHMQRLSNNSVYDVNTQ